MELLSWNIHDFDAKQHVQTDEFFLPFSIARGFGSAFHGCRIGTVWDLLCMCVASPDSLPYLTMFVVCSKRTKFRTMLQAPLFERTMQMGVNNGLTTLTAECNWDPVLFDSFCRAWRGSSMADDCIRVAADASSAASAP